MSDARKKAEEAVNGISAAIEETIEVRLLVPLRALLAEEPEAAVLPLEAPECNDGDDCCRYCGRGLQPCGACKPAPPPADAATEAVDEVLRWLDLLTPCCEMFNHHRKDRHKATAPCPIEARYKVWRTALSARRGDV